MPTGADVRITESRAARDAGGAQGGKGPVGPLYRLTPSNSIRQAATAHRETVSLYHHPPSSTPPAAASMGQLPSKVHKSPSATKSVSSLKRVSRLFQPGLKQQHASGSNRSSPQAEDATSHPPGDDPEAEGRPAGGADDQV